MKVGKCLLLVIFIQIGSMSLHAVASVQKVLINQILNYALSETITIDTTKIESALVKGSIAREAPDSEQHVLLYVLLNHAQNQSIMLTASGLGDALVEGSATVGKEIVTLLLNHATRNSIVLPASAIKDALQKVSSIAPKATTKATTPEQLFIVFSLLEYARLNSIDLTDSDLKSALQDACTNLHVPIIKMILRYVVQRDSFNLSATTLTTALTNTVQDQNVDVTQPMDVTKQSEIVYLILNYAKNNLSGMDQLTGEQLGCIIEAAAEGYISPTTTTT